MPIKNRQSRMLAQATTESDSFSEVPVLQKSPRGSLNGIDTDMANVDYLYKSALTRVRLKKLMQQEQPD